ncbi:aspartate kinase [Desulfoplanes sp.]
MHVIKIGGGCLHGRETIAQILDLIAVHGRGQVIVVSALNGITNSLIQGMELALEDEENVPAIISRLKSKHMLVANHLIASRDKQLEFAGDLSRSLSRLERLYYGLNFTREISPRMRDIISSFGERFSAALLAFALECRGCKATYRLPHKIGMVTDGKFGDATANLPLTTENFKDHLIPATGPDTVVFVPGFFGVSEDGDVTTFGRGGSDYSAAVVAAALDADSLEIWKDVDGFLSADPRLVQEASLIPTLSYEEAAELAYFGAAILHPRTIEPVRRKKIPITIKNTLHPEVQGSVITMESPRCRMAVKSVAHTTDIGILKVHASGVGARQGILGLVANRIAEAGINIKSVVTSQTCISLLLANEDLEAGHRALETIKPRPYQRIEKVDNAALIAIVGDGLLKCKGIAARCFGAVAKADVCIEMISFGPSKAALYFLVPREDLETTVNAIHTTFFPENDLATPNSDQQCHAAS